MATVLPFTGMRPRQDLAERVAAPPYDVVSSAEARALVRGNPYSFLHISKPEIDLDPGVDVYSDKVYNRGRESIEQFIADGIFRMDDNPGFYLYRQTLGKHVQTGIVALVSADDYENGIIRKHELTRPDKETDRTRHMQAVKAQTGPVFLTYRSETGLSLLMTQCALSEPVNDFTSDGVRHQFWLITETAVQQQIKSGFQLIPHLYVADGHHRSAAAVRYRALCRDNNPDHDGSEAYNYFMAVLFPHNQLNILGYHRVIRDLGDYTSDTFLDALGAHFDISDSPVPVLPAAAHSFGLYLKGRWHTLTFRPPASGIRDAVAALDVSILQDTILTPLLGITDPRTDARVDFIGGARGTAALEQAVDSGDYKAAFTCFPVTIEQLMTIADAGRLMPPKSTWFEPKLKSGLVIHKLEPKDKR